MTDKQKDVLNKLSELVKLLTDAQLDRLIILTEGMVIMQSLTQVRKQEKEEDSNSLKL